MLQLQHHLSFADSCFSSSGQAPKSRRQSIYHENVAAIQSNDKEKYTIHLTSCKHREVSSRWGTTMRSRATLKICHRVILLLCRVSRENNMREQIK